MQTLKAITNDPTYNSIIWNRALCKSDHKHAQSNEYNLEFK